MSLADQLRASAPNKETTNAEAPNDAILSLFSGVLAKRSKPETTDKARADTPKKKQKLEDSSSEEDTSEEVTSSSENEEELREPKIDTPPRDNTEQSEQESDQIPAEDLKNEENEEIIKEKNERTIFVGNLPTKVTERGLRKIFKKYGEIENIRFRSVAVATPTLPKKVSFIKKQFNDKVDDIHAYVVFKTPEEAKKALEMNGQLFMERHLRVDIAAFQKKKLTNSCSIFVGNLPYDIDDESLWQHFGSCGTICAVRVVRDSQYRIGKGFGYVMFDTPFAVKNALKLEGSKLKGRKIRVSKAIRKEKKSKAVPTTSPKKPRKPGRRTERSRNFQGKKAIEGKEPRLHLPQWKQEAKKKNAKTKQKLKQKKRNK